MKIDLDQIITGIGQEPLKNDGKSLNIKTALLIALIGSENGTVENAVKSRKLFNFIDRAEGCIDLKSEEVVMLKNICAKGLTPVVAGSVVLALEPEDAQPK